MSAKDEFTIFEKKMNDGKVAYGIVRPLNTISYDNLEFYKMLLLREKQTIDYCQRKFLAKFAWEDSYLSFEFKSHLDAKNCARYLTKRLGLWHKSLEDVPRHDVSDGERVQSAMFDNVTEDMV